MKKIKGMTTQMMILIVALLLGLVMLGIFVVYASKEAEPGGLATTFGRGACGALTPFGLGKTICNL